MQHDNPRPRFSPSVRSYSFPVIVALVVACGAADEDGGGVASFQDMVPGTAPAGSPPGTGGGPDGTNAPNNVSVSPDPSQPSSGENPATNGSTPLEPGVSHAPSDANGATPPSESPSDPNAQNPPPRSDGVTGTTNLFTQLNGRSQAEVDQKEAPASDGEEYFAAALFLADRRWGSNGAINYEQDADTLASAMLHNVPGDDGRFSLIHARENMVVFVPYGTSNEFSDPSYHLPAFYEIFAQDGPAEDAARWLEIAEISRQYVVDSAHPDSGLHPDYANFGGTPSQGYQASNHDTFRFDAWRVPLNMAVDYAWSREDSRLRTQVEKYHAFFNGDVTASLFNLDGSGGSGGSSQALISTLAAGALASNAGNRAAYVNSLWNVAQPTGQFRYYQGAVYLLGLLATSGHFDFAFPQ